MRTIVGTLLVAASALTLSAADGNVLATTGSATTFRLYVNGTTTFSLLSAAEVAAWPITWRTNETVVATAMDGTSTTLVTDATASGAQSLSQIGGAWTLSNSKLGSAVICIPWSVFNDGGTLDTSMNATFGADLTTDGPDRQGEIREFPPIAYSGDSWVGDATKSATVTITPPAGSGLAVTNLNLEGTGAIPFVFGRLGQWAIQLAAADGTTRDATITVKGGGLSLVFR